MKKMFRINKKNTRSGMALLLIMTLIGCEKASFDSSLNSSLVANLNAPSADTSTISISSPNYADGATPAIVSLVLKNAANEPVEGHIMSLRVSGSNNTMTACTASDRNGQSRCKVFSTKSEMKTVSVWSDINLSAQTMFDPALTTNVAGIVSSGDIQNNPASTRIFSSSGIMQSSNKMNESNGTLRIHSSFHGHILSSW